MDRARNTTVISVNQSDQAQDTEERMLRPEAIVTRTSSNRSTNNDTRDVIVKGKKLGHRRVKDGEVTYKKFQTTQLMGSIQLGIQQSVGNLASQEDRDLLHEDFYTVETVVFSRDGSLQKTPAHNYTQFKVGHFRQSQNLSLTIFYFSSEPMLLWPSENSVIFLELSETSSWFPSVPSL